MTAAGETAAARTAAGGTAAGPGVAARLAAAAAPFVGGELPVRLVAWDGSSAGPAGAPRVALRSPDALRRVLWQPGELGLAQAYVTGELEVEGDLDESLTRVRAALTGRRRPGGRRPVPSPAALVRALRTAAGLDLLGRPPAPPASQARLPRGLRGRLHQRSRDRWAISHHYDIPAAFYELLLDGSMAYSCGYWTGTPDQPAYSLEDAQRDKLDLVCRKLGLRPGMRLLDVGCGWGSLTLYAAEHVGVQVTGITIAAEQQRFVERRVRARGLSDRVEVRLQDYRDVRAERAGEWDAVASIEMGEHVGEQSYPTYAATLHRAVRPGGRVLVQQMSRPGRRGGRHPGGGPFIESFIAPDMHMRPVGETVALLEAAGLEVRDVHALREHYVRTVAAWLERFEKSQEALAALVGEEVVRVWRLYLVGGAQAFRDGRMGVDQILCVRPAAGRSGLDPVRAW